MTAQSVPASAIDPRVYARRWWTLAVLCLSLVLIGLDNTILNVALPTIQRTFNATASDLQWLVDAYVLVFAGLLLTMGALGDRFGRARALQVGLVIFGGSSLLAPLATDINQLIAIRVAMGVGGALIMPSTLSIIANVFPSEERARAITIWAGVSGLGVGLGPLVGGLLIENFAWSSVFLLNVPIVLIALALGVVFVPESRDPSGARLDLPGAVLSIGAVTALVYGIIEAPGRGWTDSVIIGSFVVAAILAAAFGWRETHTAAPMLDLALFRDRRFTAGAGAIALTFFALFGVIFGLTQFLQFVLGKTALEAGALMVTLAIGIPVGARISLKAVEHAGTRRTMAGGLIWVTLVLLTLTQWSPSTETWVVSLTLFFLAIGLANVMAPGTGTVMSAVPEAKAGVGSAMNDLLRQLGGALGVAVIGSVMNTVYRDQMTDVVAPLPGPAADAARDSVGAAVAIAGQIGGPAGDALATVARVAFVDALGLAAAVAAGVALATAVFVARAMPREASSGLGHGPAPADVSSRAAAASGR
ncbi:MAG TPA: DHA2 family efflux MFS transporter permease subunit [Candidatus Limnocylindrales bacterium]|nr:DHA2 family efflux MFS transporter permease subunit [Candidatus Limnocylindrales bacterium]